MAQLRQQYNKIVPMDAEVLVIGPENQEDFANYWDQNELQFIGLPDPENRVANLYRQQVNIFKLGRMPAMVVIDKTGKIYYSHYGDSMRDIVSIEKIFTILNELSLKAQVS